MENIVKVVSVRGIKDINGDFKPHKIIDEELDEAPDLDALVESKPKGRGKKVEAVKPETTELQEQEKEQEKEKEEEESKTQE